MVDGKIAQGELSSEASAESQKYRAECILQSHWTTHAHYFALPCHFMGFRSKTTKPINLSGFNVGNLLKCLRSLGVEPELEDGLGPLVTRDFLAGCF